jgi:hypothetical protein
MEIIKRKSVINRYKHVRTNLILNCGNTLIVKGEFYLAKNSAWSSEIVDQNLEIKTVSQTTPILFSTPGMIMRWWEN